MLKSLLPVTSNTETNNPSLVDQMSALTTESNKDEFYMPLATPTCQTPACDVMDTQMSLYQFCDPTFASATSEDESIQSTPREKLNAFLNSRDVSPIRYPLSAPLEQVSDRTKRFHMRKACQVVSMCLEEIAPGQSTTLLEGLSSDKTTEADERTDSSLLDALSECYLHTNHWSTRRQILSIMVDKVTFKELQKWIPNLTRYRFNVAKHHLLLHGRGSVIQPLKNTRVCVQPGKIDHFVTFITSSQVIQDLPFGEKTLKLSTDRVIKIPNVVRNLIPEQCILQYESYCQEKNFQPMSRSILRRVLSVCSASVRKSLQGLDYISANGGKAFDDLENIVDKLGDCYEMGLTWAKQTNQKLKDAKRYLKGDYKVITILFKYLVYILLQIHISNHSEVADHCRAYALSSCEDKYYQTVCDHDHNARCDRCRIFPEALSEILEALNEVRCSSEEKDDMEYVITRSVQDIETWKAHILRSINQDAARHDILGDLNPGCALIVLDWAMKFVPRKYRESQRDWFGKRGFPWHITVLTKKNKDREVQMLTFVHIFKSCSQDSTTVVAIIDDVLRQLPSIAPDIHSVYLRQDNAGCYHSALTLLSLPKIAKETKIKIRRIDFSDPQGGKGACDRKAAHIKNHMNKYLNSGKDIENPEQMKAAIESFGGIPGVKVIVCALPTGTICAAGKWKGVSHINNIEYGSRSMKVWMAYGIGAGQNLLLSKFCVPSKLPNLIHNKDTTSDQVSFITVKARIQAKTSHEEQADINDDEQIESEESPGTPSKLFFCREQGCIRSYQRYSSLEKHLDYENHKNALEHETLYDRAMKLYATQLEEGTSKNPEPTRTNDLPRFDIGPDLQMGWALKSSAKKTRFSVPQKTYLIDVFDVGEQTGQKADPCDVSREMRSARHSDGSHLFSKSEFLTAQQIASFFSRLAKKRRTDAAVHDDDDDEDDDYDSNEDGDEVQENGDDSKTEKEREIQILSQTVLDTIGLQHPIMFERHNICELKAQEKLSRFSLPMLQEMCTSLELDTTDITIKRKKPYIDLLGKLVSTCSCSID
ncbi:uncharacterized protein [Antedon mediterranea]|uniref:uncharacterized protein n=1 Tax=Antedon mediterranea TaxID=105859 RepID=UPI003AF7E0C3